MNVLVYRKCSTCMKALKWLDEHNINYEERAIKEENPTYEELKKWDAKSGLPLKKFFNTGGMIYKEMGLKDKLKDIDLIKLVSNETSTPRKGIRKVDIMEKFSFFEVPNGCEDEILGVLTKQKYKGRKINVEIAQRKNRR